LRFLLDMGVSYKVAIWLNGMEHNAIHLNDEGLHKMNDHSIIEKAIKEDRVILTADMDFGHILSFTKANNVSVIQFRIFDLSPENIIAKLTIVFDKFSDELNSHSIILTVQEKKIRIKDLPI
jgi:predicted nuclease of predicted toxin-antitoxin system